MTEPASLQAIAAIPPDLPVTAVKELVAEQYGLVGEFAPLISERDQNFRLKTADGNRFVVKIANAAEQEATTDFQIRALLHLERKACPVPVPTVVRTTAGEVATSIADDLSSHVLRVVSYVPGRPLERVTADARLANELGTCAARLDQCLGDFEHPGDSQSLLWDMQRASDLRALMPHIPEVELRAAVQGCLNDFEQHAAPEFSTLRRQIIHNDINPGNVLVSDSAPVSVAGVIDFGDMIRAPLIVDVAIAASYLRSDAEDPLGLSVALVAGYNEVTLLETNELDLLYYLVRMRLATTITMMYWRISERSGDDAYTQKALQNERSSERFLARTSALGRGQFADRLQAACGR